MKLTSKSIFIGLTWWLCDGQHQRFILEGTHICMYYTYQLISVTKLNHHSVVIFANLFKIPFSY